MEGNSIDKIKAEVESRVEATGVGMLTIRTANKTLWQAELRPVPENQYWDSSMRGGGVLSVR